MIDYSKQSINQKDVIAVSKALKEKLITTGNITPKFEKKICTFVKSKYAVAVNSATSALHISCLALNLKKNDYLWTTCNTFVATVNCGLYCGAKIDLVDIDPHSYNISIDILKKKLNKAKLNKKIPKILIPVHFSGLSSEMSEINNLSKFYGFKIIEDASHAFGGIYNKTIIGSCKYSDITVFSFHPTKIITTIEGGVATTNNKKIYEKLMLFRSHGILKKYIKKNFFFMNYQQIELGFNYRMNDIQAALGLSQLSRINFFLKKRRSIAKIYLKERTNKFIKLPTIKNLKDSTFHLFVIRIQNYSKFINRDYVYKKLLKLGIGVNLHYIPIHYHKFYKKFLFSRKKYNNAENYYNEAISLPIHPDLSLPQLRKIIFNFKRIFYKKN